MGQVTIYLDSEVEKKLRSAAKANNMSQSKWVASLIREKTMTHWPREIAELAGKWSDLPSAEEIRKDLGEDSSRELL
jgi:hypothetical protein